MGAPGASILLVGTGARLHGVLTAQLLGCSVRGSLSEHPAHPYSELLSWCRSTSAQEHRTSVLMERGVLLPAPELPELQSWQRAAVSKQQQRLRVFLHIPCSVLSLICWGFSGLFDFNKMLLLLICCCCFHLFLSFPILLAKLSSACPRLATRWLGAWHYGFLRLHPDLKQRKGT